MPSIHGMSGWIFRLSLFRRVMNENKKNTNDRAGCVEEGEVEDVFTAGVLIAFGNDFQQRVSDLRRSLSQRSP